MGGSVLCIRTDCKAAVVRIDADGVSQLCGVNQRLTTGLRRTNGSFPAPAVRASALLKALQRGLPYSLAECCIDAAPVDFRQAANSAQCGLRIALQADAVHLKAPHACTAEQARA